MSDFLIIAASIPVCAALNRWRGGGVFPNLSGANGTIATTIFALILYLASLNASLAICFFLAYLLGESFGWSKWINCVPGHLTQTEYNNTWLGDKNERSDKDLSTILASRFVDEAKDYELYCFLGMAIRGLMWWVPVFSVFAVFGVLSIISAALFTIGISALFPVAYRLAYQNTENKDKYVRNAELVYGAIYGVPFGTAVSNLIT